MRRALWAGVVLLLGFSSLAAADPVRITFGDLSFPYPSDFVGFDLVGNGFAATGSATPSAPVASFSAGTVDLSGEYAIGPYLRELGSVTVGGVTQQGYGAIDLHVTAQEFLVPDLAGRHTFSTMFSALGFVNLYSAQGEQLLSQAVNGTGTLFIEGSNIGDGRYATHFEGLEFAPGAAATPEPGSMLLLGTGLACLWRARGGRAQNDAPDA